jgi:hypothetical protein
MAWQHGRLYPASGANPAVLLVTTMTKHEQGVPVPTNGAAFVRGGPVSDASLAILKRTGILRLTLPGQPSSGSLSLFQ